MSELFTRSTALKFDNAVTKPPRQLSPSYSGLRMFRISNPTMEEIGATNPKYQPLRVLWRPFVAPTLEKPSFWHLFTRLLNK